MKDDKDSSVSLVKFWAAVSDETAVGVISMRVPHGVDFDAFREKATECLSLLGEVRSGDVYERGARRYFVQRLTHANRSKKPRVPKIYPVDESRQPIATEAE